MNIPNLQTERLFLRTFTLTDAPDVMRMAGDPDVARFTLLIPHPYEAGMAESWIRSHPAALETGEQITFAVVIRETGQLCGAIGLALSRQDQNAELGYWIGKEFWGRGYGTEAAREMLRYGFESLKLHRVFAGHFATNPASGRLLKKIGMRHEGVLREHHLKWGEFVDRVQYGILARDERAEKPASPMEPEA